MLNWGKLRCTTALWTMTACGFVLSSDHVVAADFTIPNGSTVTSSQTLNAGETGTVDATGVLENNGTAVTMNGGATLTVNGTVRKNNAGNIDDTVVVNGTTAATINVGGAGRLANDDTNTGSSTINVSQSTAIIDATVSNGGTMASAGDNVFGVGAGNIQTQTLNNAGTISAAGNGTRVFENGHWAITNSGTIQNNSAGGPTIHFRRANNITNTGTIQNTSTGLVFSPTNSVAAIDDTIVNSGTISTAGTTAIRLFNGNDTLQLRAGSQITGNVLGGGRNR